MKMFDHRRTGTGWSDYGVRIRCLKYLDKSPSKLLSLVSISGIKCRLAAARLAIVKNYFAAEPSQNSPPCSRRCSGKAGRRDM